MKVSRFGTIHAVVLLLLLIYSKTAEYDTFVGAPWFIDYVPEVAIYNRLDEVRNSCSSTTRSAVDLNLQRDASKISLLKEELSFNNGDWEQIQGTSPIMPFDDRPRPGMNSSRVGYKYDLSGEKYGSKIPYKVASFKVTDISMEHGSKKTLAIYGKLVMVITLDLPDLYGAQERYGGEGLLCLLGSSLLPSRESESSYRDIIPHLLQDDQIRLVLRFPKTTSLNRLTIRGELKSLNPKSNQKYFDEVQITAQIQAQTHNYEFSPNELISKACDPYPYSDPSISGPNEFYTGFDFCEMISKVSTDAAFAVAPHWRCNGTDEFCRKFGPFRFDTKINDTDGSFKDVRILMQNILCVADNKRNKSEAKVFAVFRVFDSPNNLFLENQRSGLDTMTIVAEGVWKSSNGQLCMIGCHGEKDDCDFRVCLYIPLSFSIEQRSLLIGSISSLTRKNPSFYPLSLGMLYQSVDYIYDGYEYKHPYYQYTKIDSAGVVLEKDEPFSFGTIVKRKFLKFPKLLDCEAYSESLRVLSVDLTLQVKAFSDTLPNTRGSRTDVQMEILSLGPMFGRDWFSNASYTEKQFLLNVSTQMKLRGKTYSNFSDFFLEGLYDQHVGKMYLIGCRDIRISWKVLYDNSMRISNGLDCETEVIISYPPTTARWLLTSTVSVSISSKRTEDDPFYFKPVKLITLPILYRQQWEDMLARRSFEGILLILSLSISMVCILRQLFYMRDLAGDALPHVSLTMLGSQVIGFTLNLVISYGALSNNLSNKLDRCEWTQVIGNTVKFQVLFCFILTLRLSRIVWKARARLPDQNRVPTEKRVVIITLITHIVGYLPALIYHSVKTTQAPIWTKQYTDSYGNPGFLKTWETVFQEYTGLLQDLFLLPQVIGNITWQIESKPLLKVYYMGLTCLRVLPHLYDYYVKGVDVNPYFRQEYEFVDTRFDFYSEFGDVVIPVLGVVLAVAVYVQQRWKYEKISDVVMIGGFRVFPVS